MVVVAVPHRRARGSEEELVRVRDADDLHRVLQIREEKHNAKPDPDSFCITIVNDGLDHDHRTPPKMLKERLAQPW